VALTKEQKEILKKFGENLSKDISNHIRNEISSNFKNIMIDVKIKNRDEDNKAYRIIYQRIYFMENGDRGKERGRRLKRDDKSSLGNYYDLQS